LISATQQLLAYHLSDTKQLLAVCNLIKPILNIIQISARTQIFIPQIFIIRIESYPVLVETGLIRRIAMINIINIITPSMKKGAVHPKNQRIKPKTKGAKISTALLRPFEIPNKPPEAVGRSRSN
jgi:hypothetical protein